MYSMPLSLHHSMHDCLLSSGDSWSSPPSSFEASVESMPNVRYSGWGSLEDSPHFCKRRRYSVWPKCEGTQSALLPTHISMSKVLSSIPDTHSWSSSNDVDCQAHTDTKDKSSSGYAVKWKILHTPSSLIFAQEMGEEFLFAVSWQKLQKDACTEEEHDTSVSFPPMNCLILTLLRSKTITRASHPFAKDCNCCWLSTSELLRHVIQIQISAV